MARRGSVPAGAHVAGARVHVAGTRVHVATSGAVAWGTHAAGSYGGRGMHGGRTVLLDLMRNLIQIVHGASGDTQSGCAVLNDQFARNAAAQYRVPDCDG